MHSTPSIKNAVAVEIELSKEAPGPRVAASQNTHQLIDSCQGLVRSLAWKIHQKLPAHVELDDLVAYGHMGLAQAARDFDATRGNRFITYAHHRIRGAIFDGLSQMSWFSRQDYYRSRYEHMANDLLRMQGDEDASAATVEDDVRWLRDMSSSLVVVYLASVEGHRHAGAIVDDGESEPFAGSVGEELRSTLHEVIAELPAEARTLIQATYFEGLTLQDAAKRIGISKAWASRLHVKTLQRLANALRVAGVAD
jgi:RNA polymerase sigma factor FliA